MARTADTGPPESFRASGVSVATMSPNTSQSAVSAREDRLLAFALDEQRRAVETTMAGHHRTKAASSSASAGVDLAEALCDGV